MDDYGNIYTGLVIVAVLVGLISIKAPAHIRRVLTGVMAGVGFIGALVPDAPMYMRLVSFAVCIASVFMVAQWHRLPGLTRSHPA